MRKNRDEKKKEKCLFKDTRGMNIDEFFYDKRRELNPTELHSQSKSFIMNSGDEAMGFLMNYVNTS